MHYRDFSSVRFGPKQTATFSQGAQQSTAYLLEKTEAVCYPNMCVYVCVCVCEGVRDRVCVCVREGGLTRHSSSSRSKMPILASIRSMTGWLSYKSHHVHRISCFMYSS